MAPRVKHAKVLQVLSDAKPALRTAILQAADSSLVNSICECCYNVLKGNVPLSTPQKTRLSRYKKVIRNLSAKGHSTKQKKQILVQHGGFLPALLAPLIGGVLSSLFK